MPFVPVNISQSLCCIFIQILAWVSVPLCRAATNCRKVSQVADRTYIYDNSIDNQEASLLVRMVDGKVLFLLRVLIEHYSSSIATRQSSIKIGFALAALSVEMIHQMQHDVMQERSVPCLGAALCE